VWDTHTLQHIATYPGRITPVVGFIVSETGPDLFYSDQSRLRHHFYGNHYGTVSMWDPHKQQMIVRLQGMRGLVKAIDGSGMFIAIAGA
jgi:hypothetical protein